MTLISDSTYRKACAELIEAALLRPGMYFNSLEELQAILWGHAYAFDQKGLTSRDDYFNSCFKSWLRQKTGASICSGWAEAIETRASRKGIDPVDFFSPLVREFLDQWNDEP